MYIISILISKFTNFIIKLLKLGSGYTWPGNIVLEIYPKVLEKINIKLPSEVVFVSGTNGKTTTVKLIKHILESQGARVLSNGSGANLINGVVSTVLLNSDMRGRIPYDIAVFELDELNLPKIMEYIKPKILVLLNLSRDQLDRYWEKDVIFDKWVNAVSNINSDTTLILDKNQPEFIDLAKEHQGKTHYFDEDLSVLSGTNLIGNFNAKNVNCALLVSEKLGVDRDISQASLKEFNFAYGRGEIINYKDKVFQIFLAKNPESLNQNLKLINDGDIEFDTILYILNDNIPDGKDVSWIYDVDPTLINNVNTNREIFVSGKRALDMAVRLHYAQTKLLQENIKSNYKDIIKKIASDQNIKRVAVLPNYSAMLEFRKEVVGRKIL